MNAVIWSATIEFLLDQGCSGPGDNQGSCSGSDLADEIPLRELQGEVPDRRRESRGPDRADEVPQVRSLDRGRSIRNGNLRCRKNAARNGTGSRSVDGTLCFARRRSRGGRGPSSSSSTGGPRAPRCFAWFRGAIEQFASSAASTSPDGAEAGSSAGGSHQCGSCRCVFESRVGAERRSFLGIGRDGGSVVEL